VTKETTISPIKCDVGSLTGHYIDLRSHVRGVDDEVSGVGGVGEHARYRAVETTTCAGFARDEDDDGVGAPFLNLHLSYAWTHAVDTAAAR